MTFAIPRKTTVAVLVVALVASLSGPVEAGRKAKKSKARPAQTAPANDDFAAAAPVKSLPFARTTNHRRATTEEGEPLGCGASNMNRTVWFRYTPTSNQELVATATSETTQALVAIYIGEDFSSLEQLGCSGNPSAAELDFYAERTQDYLIQVGSASAEAGKISFELANGAAPQPVVGDPGSLPHGWAERVLVEEERSHESDGVDLIRFHGRPSAADREIYEMDVWVAGQHVVDRLTLYTAGTMTQEHKYSALGPSKHRVAFSVKVRYDARDQRCLVGSGGECRLLLPNAPTPDEVTGGKAAKAELIVTVLVERQAGIAPIPETTQTLRIPLVGYVAALLP